MKKKIIALTMAACVAALVGCFYTRKFLQYNIDTEKGDQKDVAV